MEEFLQECLQVKQIVSDVMFHLFVQTDLSIKDIKQLGSYKYHPSFLTCFKVCHKGTQDVDSIDYKEFKKELESVLKENESKADSTTENSN